MSRTSFPSFSSSVRPALPCHHHAADLFSLTRAVVHAKMMFCGDLILHLVAAAADPSSALPIPVPRCITKHLTNLTDSSGLQILTFQKITLFKILFQSVVFGKKY
jgi:hypothetical protein